MMKKRAITAFAAIAIASAPAAALAFDEVAVTLDGRELEFDVPAQIVEDRTVVPMRAIFEVLGAAVEWDGETRTITSSKDDTTVRMTIGDSTIYINDVPILLDVAPMIINDRTVVPARAVAESFGASVDWDAETRTVNISSAADKIKNAAAELVKGAIVKAGTYDASADTYSISANPLLMKLLGSKYFTNADVGYNTAEDSIYIKAVGAVGADLGIELMFTVEADGTPGVRVELENTAHDAYVLAGVYKNGDLIITKSTLSDSLYDRAMSCIENAGELMGVFFKYAGIGVSADELGFGF